MPTSYTYDLDGRGSNRSVNNNNSLNVTYYGATVPTAGFPAGGTSLELGAPTPILGSGVSVRSQTITERLVENASTRAVSGIGSPYQIGQSKIIPELQVITVGGGVETVVTSGSRATTNTVDAGDTGERNKFNNLKNGWEPAPAEQIQLPPGNPNEYDWNLPPHQWSLPTLPTVVNEKHYSSNSLSPKRQSTDKYRRGRLWWKANPAIATLDANGNVTKLSTGDANRKYGFQFLWNPETVGTQVSVQLEATPSVQDRFLGVSGAFPATQTLSFTVRIDRTNDFACAQAAFSNQIQRIIRSTGSLPNSILQSEVEEFIKYYKPNESFAAATSKEKMAKKLVDLYQRGTIADIEYLYKAINGPGPGGATDGTEWMNGRGIKTADIGWLMPTLLHVDVGPLSYDGYVTSLQVAHTAFTPSMVPIRSDVTISLNVLATASLTTAS